MTAARGGSLAVNDSFALAVGFKEKDCKFLFAGVFLCCDQLAGGCLLSTTALHLRLNLKRKAASFCALVGFKEEGAVLSQQQSCQIFFSGLWKLGNLGAGELQLLCVCVTIILMSLQHVA